MPPSVKTLDLEESLGYIMGRVFRGLGTRINRNIAEAGYDVTCEQWCVLVNLWEKDGQSQQDLAGTTCKGKTSMTRLLDNMEKRDLVVRVPGTKDKRQKLIYLTKKGKQIQRKLLTIVDRTEQEYQRNMNAGDVARCKDVLRQMYKNME